MALLSEKILLGLFLAIEVGGRWITQIWLGPFPIIDLLFQFVILISFTRILFYPSSARIDLNHSLFPVRLLNLILFFTISKIAFSLFEQEFSFEVIIRDSITFFAIGLIPILSKVMYLAFTARRLNERRIGQLVTYASFFSFLLGIVSLLFTSGKGYNFNLPIMEFNAPILQVRPDQFFTTLTPFLGYLIYQFVFRSKYRIFFLFQYFLFSSVVLYFLSSRSVLLTFVISSVLFFYFFFRGRLKSRAQFSALGLSIFLLICPILFYIFSRVSGFGRLMSGFGFVSLSSSSDQNLVNATKTQSARNSAWRIIIEDWQNSAFWTGYEPGFNFVEQTGAVRYLSGSSEVRWPHNFWISLFVRNGFIVGTLVCFVFIYLFFVLTRFLLHFSDNLLYVQAAVLVISIIVVSSFGVVLESPFGYIPFAVSLAFLIAQQKFRFMRSK